MLGEGALGGCSSGSSTVDEEGGVEAPFPALGGIFGDHGDGAATR